MLSKEVFERLSKASEWFVRSENVLEISRSHDLKIVCAQNVRSERAGVGESDRERQMSAISAESNESQNILFE